MSNETVKEKEAPKVAAAPVTPWYQLGVDITASTTVKSAFKHAKLDWAVAKKNIRIVDGRQFKDRFAIVRDDTKDPVGVVGTRYAPIQNVDGLDIFDPVVGESLTYETAGLLRGGRIVWLLASLKNEYHLGRSDPLKEYILAFLSHDGKKPVSVRFVASRTACWNPFCGDIGEAKALYTIRHTKNHAEKAQEAANLVNLADKHADEFKNVYVQLQGMKMSEKHVTSFANEWLSGKGSRVSNSRDRLIELFRTGIGNSGETRVDMLNACTEWLTHHRPVLSKNAAESRFETNMIGYGVGMQERAVKLLLN